LVGKIGALVALAIGLFTIYSKISPSGPDLIARCDFHCDYALPPDLVLGMEDLQQSISFDTIQSEVEKFLNESGEPEDFPKHELANRLRTSFEDRWPKRFRFIDHFQSFDRPYDSLWRITLENSGDRIAEDVVLDIPLSGIAEITGRDGAIEVKDVTRTVPLGSLRPGDSITMDLWAREKLFVDTSDFRFTHREGVGDVEMPTSLYGVPAFIGRNLMLILVEGVLVIVLILWITVRSKTADHAEVTANPAEEP